MSFLFPYLFAIFQLSYFNFVLSLRVFSYVHIFFPFPIHSLSLHVFFSSYISSFVSCVSLLPTFFSSQFPEIPLTSFVFSSIFYFFLFFYTTLFPSFFTYPFSLYSVPFPVQFPVPQRTIHIQPETTRQRNHTRHSRK